MKLEDQLTSLELSKKLRELGVKQNSIWWWWDDVLNLAKGLDSENFVKYYSAFTCAELGEMLPFFICVNKIQYELCITVWEGANIMFHTGKKGFNIKYENPLIDRTLTFRTNKKLSNCMAKMLIYLIENKLMEI